MSATRTSLVDQAFDIMDETGDGYLSVEDLKSRYTVKFHPKFVSGEWTEDQCLREFLDSFDNEKVKDGKVSSVYHQLLEFHWFMIKVLQYLPY